MICITPMTSPNKKKMHSKTMHPSTTSTYTSHAAIKHDARQAGLSKGEKLSK